MNQDINSALQKCIWQAFWDFLNLHDLLNSRKGELTAVPSIILIMASGQKLSMKNVARIMGVSNSTVTDFVDQLENKGFVVRTRSKEDRRQVFIEVTDRGKEWMLRHQKITSDFIEKSLDKISPEERKDLVSLLTRVIDVDDTSPFARACAEI